MLALGDTREIEVEICEDTDDSAADSAADSAVVHGINASSHSYQSINDTVVGTLVITSRCELLAS